MGPLIKTFMTRCIQCTRCVRYMTEVAGVRRIGCDRPRRGHGDHHLPRTRHDVGAVGQRRRSMSGRRADARPWAFVARPWELRKTESVDVMDAVGSAIRVDCRGREVVRILPRNNEAVNEEWISDKTRHVGRRLAHASASTGPIFARTASCGRRAGTRCWRWLPRKLKGTAAERIGAIAGDLRGRRGDVCAEGPARSLGAAETSIVARTAQARSRARPRQLSVQFEHRRHRAGRRHPDDRRQPTARGRRAQLAHPQALAAGQPRRRRDRRSRRT